MKKFLSLVFAICLVFSITACKKETVNKEYSEYSEKVITVLTDYGIETSKSTSRKSAAYTEPKSNTVTVSAVYYERSNINEIILLSNDSPSTTNFADSKIAILDKLNNSEHSEKDLTNSIQDAFEQTFYFPLVIGSAMRDSLGVTSFYGETACLMGNQFFVTDKSGSHSITRAFIENGYENDGNHHYVVMDLDYTDSNNYEFTMVSYDKNGTSKSFYYGNSNHEFIHLYISESLKEVEYQDGEVGYVYEQSDFVNDIYALIADEFTKYEEKTFIDLKTNSKHNITQAAYDDALESIFGDTGPTAVSGLTTDDDCALHYIATNNEETITIPDNIKYLSPYFEVTDNTSKVKTLIIPNSVIGIKEGDTVLPLERLELRLTTDHQNRLFQNIIVEEGSTLLKSDGFKLTSYDEKTLLYVMGNDSSDTLDLSMCTKANNNIMQSVNFAVFKNLKTLKYNLLDMYDGGGEQIDLLSDYAGNYCWSNNIPFEVKLDELIIGNIKSDSIFIVNEVMEMSSDNYITKLTLNGNINELYANDYNGIIKDIVINSPDKTQITGVLNGITRIEITSNEWVGFSSENISEVVICEGVTETSLYNLYGDVAEELTIYLPSTLTRFVGGLPEIPQGSIGKYKIVAKMSSALINGEFKDLLRNFDTDNQWVIEYDVSAEEQRTLNDFKEIVNYSEQENALDINNYFGSDSVVFVPSTVAGVQVRAFRLNNSEISYDNVGQHQTIASVKELHLPSALKIFSITYNDSYDENYHIDKIYYDGNYSDFEAIFFTDVSYLFEFELCEQLICNDKTITKNSFHSSWAYETITVGDDNVVCDFSNVVVSYDGMKGTYYISGNVYNNRIDSEMQYLAENTYCYEELFPSVVTLSIRFEFKENENLKVTITNYSSGYATSTYELTLIV